MPKPVFTVVISGIEREEHALDLTKALLLIQEQRRIRKPLWRGLLFRPIVFSEDEARLTFTNMKPVILREGSTELVTGTAPPPRETFPFLKRTGHAPRPHQSSRHRQTPPKRTSSQR